MMQMTMIVANNHVQVLWQRKPEMVVVTCLRSQAQQPFAGYDGLQDLFNSYCDSFNEHLGYKATVDFFKPNIQQSIVHAPGN